MSNNGVFKSLDPNKVINSVEVLNEQIPITGTIIAGTYGTFPNEENIKYFASTQDHVDVYDYPHASSSANFLFSMTAGYASGNPGGVATASGTLKNNIYRQFSQQYVGYDTNQNPVEFNVSGVLNPEDAFPPKFESCIFINLSRVIMKDEIKKGSFTIKIGTGSFANPFADGLKTFSDAHVVEGNEATYKTNSPMGEYALLQDGTSATVPTSTTVGFLYYQAGLVVLAASQGVFGTELTSGTIGAGEPADGARAAQSPSAAILSASIDDITSGVRAHINNIQFNNATELNSTSYFLNAGPNEFNYSNNPSYVSGSEIIVKNGKASNPSVAYITSAGLYSVDGQLLAVGKLSEPLKKTPSNEISLKMRIDY